MSEAEYHARQRANALENDVRRLRKEVDLRKSFMNRLPLCPNCRDKVAGEPCLKCQIDRLLDERKRARKEIRQVLDYRDLRPSTEEPLRRALAALTDSEDPETR